jgi:hypothetical protein
VLAAVLDACTDNLQWGLWDQARLFGIPDVIEPFQAGPREVTGFAVRNIGHFLMDRLFKKPVKSTTTFRKVPKFLMRAWTAYRMVATTISMTLPLALCLCCRRALRDCRVAKEKRQSKSFGSFVQRGAVK